MHKLKCGAHCFFSLLTTVIKMKHKKYNTDKTNPKHNQNIIETERKLMPLTHIQPGLVQRQG